MYSHLTPDEYDIAIMEAERDLAISGIVEDGETVSDNVIVVDEATFDNFVRRCENPGKPNKALSDAVRDNCYYLCRDYCIGGWGYNPATCPLKGL